MKKLLTYSTPLLLALISAGLPAQDLIPESELDPGAPKPEATTEKADDTKKAGNTDSRTAQVRPAKVSIGGIARPELGQAIADSLTAGLLRRGYRIVPGSDNVDFELQSTLVGDEGFYHFTLSKIDTATDEILDVQQVSHRGGMEGIFPMVTEALQGLHEGEPVPAAERAVMASTKKKDVVGPGAFPPGAPPLLVEHSQQVFEEAVRTEVQRREAEKTAREREAVVAQYRRIQAAQAAATRARMAEAKAKSAPPRRRFHASYVRQQVGTITAVNDAWKFCIIEPNPGRKFEISDMLESLYTEESRQPYAKLIVTRRAASGNGGVYVASFGTRMPNRHLHPGEPIYQWVPQRVQY